MRKARSPRFYALLSVAAALATMALKFFGYSLTGSVGLFSDAAESVVNLAAALVAVWAVTLAARPADEEHAYHRQHQPRVRRRDLVAPYLGGAYGHEGMGSRSAASSTLSCWQPPFHGEREQANGRTQRQRECEPEGAPSQLRPANRRLMRIA